MTRPMRILLWSVLTAATVVAASTAFASWRTDGVISWRDTIDRFVWWLAWCVMLPLAAMITRFLQRPGLDVRRSAYIIVYRGVLLFGLAEVVRMLCRIAARVPFMPWRKAIQSVVEFRSIVIADLLIGAAIVTAVGLISLRWRVVTAEAEALDAERRLTTVRLAFLSEQLKPHFLFNSLNGVVALMNDDPAAAKAMLRRLVEFLERSFSRELDRLTTVSDELQTAAAYAAIQEQRYDGLVTVRFDVDEKTADLSIPPFLLQPLIENAVQHGITGTEPGEVVVHLHQRGGRLLVQVEDSGRGYPHGMIERVGIGNTRDRVQAHFPDASFTLSRSSRGGASVAIEFPAIAASGSKLRPLEDVSGD